ncbi:hypothetical protein CMI41_02710 [Candidatus Pacearchaeota archaeon]|nr:hypothetical protein [Candidatus Pacearchaeota archaeon]|tara:strand:- start:10646 stop:11050 length:405 start_codon:yes stop_codon:yes gene_type:complete
MKGIFTAELEKGRNYDLRGSNRTHNENHGYMDHKFLGPDGENDRMAVFCAWTNKRKKSIKMTMVDLRMVNSIERGYYDNSGDEIVFVEDESAHPIINYREGEIVVLNTPKPKNTPLTERVAYRTARDFLGGGSR